jgi:hypothetical protein
VRLTQPPGLCARNPRSRTPAGGILRSASSLHLAADATNRAQSRRATFGWVASCAARCGGLPRSGGPRRQISRHPCGPRGRLREPPAAFRDFPPASACGFTRRCQLAVGCLLLFEAARQDRRVLIALQLFRPGDQRAIAGDVVLLGTACASATMPTFMTSSPSTSPIKSSPSLRRRRWPGTWFSSVAPCAA